MELAVSTRFPVGPAQGRAQDGYREEGGTREARWAEAVAEQQHAEERGGKRFKQGEQRSVRAAFWC